jgi:hypothetical protein
MISIVDNVIAEIIAGIGEGEHCCKEQRQEYGEMASWQPPIAQIQAKEFVRLANSFWEQPVAPDFIGFISTSSYDLFSNELRDDRFGRIGLRCMRGSISFIQFSGVNGERNGSPGGDLRGD